MRLRLMLAASLAAIAAPAVADPVQRLERARVTAVSPMMPGSGIVAFYRDFDVALPGGGSMRLYVLWFGPNQYMPEVGAVCMIAYRREALVRGNAHRPERESAGPEAPVNVVHELSCAPGAGTPPPALRPHSAT